MSTPLPEKIERVLESCLYVNDLIAAERFYTDVLGLTFYSRQTDRHVFFRCGQQMVLLFDPAESKKGAHGSMPIPPHGAVGQGHLCFTMHEAALAEWSNHLARHGVPIEQIIDWPGGGRSLYFRDPSGNSLELATPRIWGIGEETLA